MTKTSPKVAIKTVPKSTPRKPGKECAPRKRDRLVALLMAKGGVSTTQISAELGWLPHTARAARSGLRKAGRDIERITAEGEPSRYRIKIEVQGPG